MSASVEPVKRQRSATQSSTSIRSKVNDRLNKIQAKHTAEVDLLEDLKQFSRQRSVLERQYSENLHRLVTQFSGRREILPPPTIPGFEKHENRGLLEVWKALLAKTEELSKRRLTMSELLITQVSDVAKQQKRIKEATFKRLIEICQKMNSELLESAKELSSSKKSYGDNEKISEEARSKYSELETRLKKRDVKFFESVSTLEKHHNKASDRLKQCQKRTTACRNDYLLAIATTNAHLKRHCTKDLPRLMQAIDGEMYDKVRNAYSLYAQIEADSANFIKAEFEDLAEQAYLVNREYMLECYLHCHPVLRELKEFTFEPYGQDTVRAISRDHGAEIFLDKDARKWANQLTKDQVTITSLQKQVKGLQSVTSAYTKNPEFGTSESQAEALLKTDMLLEEVRQLEVQVTKAEARLQELRQAGIDVNKWLQKAEKRHKNPEKSSSSELTPAAVHGRVSQLSLPFSAGSSQDFDVETSSLNSAQMDFDPFSGASSAEAKSEADKTTPQHCTVLYSYTAQRDDELSIVEQEELVVLEWDDGDGWCKGRKQSGQEGYFPQSYVQLLSRPPSPATHDSNPATALKFDVGTPTQPDAPAKPRVMLKALYEYTAQFAEELSFPEGAMLQLLRTDENGVDDGWWEGSYQGKVGVFPSLVVEICKEEMGSPDLNSTLLADHQLPPLESPPPLPPDYSPPPIESSDSSLGGGVGPSATMVPDYTNTFSYPDPNPVGTPINSASGSTFSPSNSRGGWAMDSSFDSDDGTMV